MENSNKLQKIELANELNKKEIEIEDQKLLNVASMKKINADNNEFTLWLISGFVLFAIMMIGLVKVRYTKHARLYQSEIADLQSKLNALLQNDAEKFEIKIKEINQQLQEPLSSREFQILEFIFSKKSNLDIGKELGLSVNTIKYHFKSIFKKIGVKNRKEALQFLLARF